MSAWMIPIETRGQDQQRGILCRDELEINWIPMRREQDADCDNGRCDRVRVSGSSLGKQMGIILGGGIAPWWDGADGIGRSFTSVILYFEVIAACAFVGILLAPESVKRAL